MTDEISCLIAFAKERFRELGLSENTIRNYDERSFNQIVRKYDESNVALYQQAIMDDFIDEIESQLRSNAVNCQIKLNPFCKNKLSSISVPSRSST